MGHFSLAREFWQFLKYRKKYWLLPLVLNRRCLLKPQMPPAAGCLMQALLCVALLASWALIWLWLRALALKPVSPKTT